MVGRSLDFWIFGILDIWKRWEIQKSKIPTIQTSRDHLLEHIGFLDFWILQELCYTPSHKLDKDERLYTRTMLMTAYKDAPDAIKVDAHETPDPGHQEAG